MRCQIRQIHRIPICYWFANVDSDLFTRFSRKYLPVLATKALSPNTARDALPPEMIMYKLTATANKSTSFSSADRNTSLTLLKQYRQNPQAHLRNRLVRLNLGLVTKEVSFWAKPHTELYEDLLQVGAMGLLGAIERFEIERGYAFSSFAVRYIRGEIQHYLRDKTNVVKMPRRWQEIYQQGLRLAQKLRSTLGREPSTAELAAALEITPAQWQEIRLAYQNREPLSLDAPIKNDDKDATSLLELMPDPHSSNEHHDWSGIHQALAHLEGRTRTIMEFVFLEDRPQREVAVMLGISAVTVSRQVKKGLDTLRSLMLAEAC